MPLKFRKKGRPATDVMPPMGEDPETETVNCRRQEPVGVADHALRQRSEDEHPADRVADQSDGVEMDEISAEVAVRKTQAAKQAFGEAVR